MSLLITADDNKETALKRIETFREQSGPTLDYLRGHGVDIHTLDGTATPEGVWEQFVHLDCPLSRIATHKW